MTGIPTGTKAGGSLQVPVQPGLYSEFSLSYGEMLFRKRIMSKGHNVMISAWALSWYDLLNLAF